MAHMRNRAVVIDIGSGFTKMGFAGNVDPELVIPTCVANLARKGGNVHISQAQGAGIIDADYYIGNEAYDRKDSQHYLLSNPVSRGRIEKWDDMERFLHQAIFRNLRCVPEDHNFLLTEPPFNAPENRELMGELMFETFNVNGLHIAVQSVLALYAQWMQEAEEKASQAAPSSQNLTGLVVDAGDGLTHIIPVADGFVISSCVLEIPLAGQKVTEFICDILKDRGEPVPPEQRMEAARQIKEQYSYLCKDVVTEFRKFDEGARKLKILKGCVPRTGQEWQIQVGYERFLAPEVFFQPEIFSDSMTTPLPQLVDTCIRQCPLDYQRTIYSNIVLAGGSTTFTYFKERLQRDIQEIVAARLAGIAKRSGVTPVPIDVQVHAGKKKDHQRYASWLGGSIFAEKPNFEALCKTKKMYDEIGPSCMRPSPVLIG